MTIEEAERYFKSCWCSRFGIYRDILYDDKAKAYFNLHISDEQEEKWRIEEIIRRRNEIILRDDFSSEYRLSIPALCFMIKECSDQQLKKDLSIFLLSIVKKINNENTRGHRIIDLCDQIKDVLKTVRNFSFRKKHKKELLEILYGLKKSIKDEIPKPKEYDPIAQKVGFKTNTSENIIEYEKEYKKTLNRVIRGCRWL